MSWYEKPLGELCDDGDGLVKTGPFGSQLHQSDYSNEGTPVVMPKDIVGGRINPDTVARVGIGHVERLSQHQLKVGDIIYGRRGDIGRCALVTEQEQGWLCGTGCLRIELGNAEVDPSFLFYFLNHPDTIKWIFNHAIGATMPNLNTAILRSIPIRYPERPTQHRIASILSAYDYLIENNTRRIAVLEEMARRLYEEWFVRFRFPGHEDIAFADTSIGRMPNDWNVEPLGNLVDEIRGTVHPSNVPPDTPYVGLEHIPRRSITLRQWSTADTVDSSKFRFQRRDILFGKIRPYFHKVTIAPIEGICSSDTILLRSTRLETLGLALCCMSSDAFVDHATQTSNGTKMPRANWNVLKEYPVPIPSEPLLTTFNDIIETVVEQTRVLMLKNRNLRTQRDLLLPKLISGEIDVTETTLPDAEDAAA